MVLHRDGAVEKNYFILIKEKSLIVAFMLYVIAASNIIFLFPKSVI